MTPSDIPQSGPRPAFEINPVQLVQPLDAQIGADPLLTVPEPLFAAVFGWPGPVPDGPQQPPATYAVIDAARITSLPERLEASGLAHDCLFQGQAKQDMGNVAPWIVRLEDNAAFTRHLFTDAGAHWDLYPLEASILIRSHLPLQDLRAHLRKFTRVQNSKGDWMFMRFYDPRWTLPLMTGMSGPDVARFLTGISHLVILRADGQFVVVTVDAALASATAPPMANPEFHGGPV